MKRLTILMTIIVLIAGSLAIVSCGDGDDGDNGKNGEATPPETEEQRELTGEATYSGQWSGSIQGMGDVDGTWEFEVNFDSGNVTGWFDGDASGNISGSVAGGEIEASGSAALGSVTWTGAFDSDGNEISGDWQVSQGMGNGTWQGAQGEAQESTPSEPEETTGGENGDEQENGEEEGASVSDIVGKAEGIDCFHYKAFNSAPSGSDSEVEVWMSGDRLRAETFVNNESTILIEDFSTGDMLVYTPNTGEAFKMNMGEGGSIVDMDEVENPLEGVESLLEWNTNVIGTEEVNGKDCIIVEYTFNNETTTVWVWEEYGFPVKTVVETTGGEFVTEFTDIDFDCPPEDKFSLPANVEVMDLSDMMGDSGGGSSGIPDIPDMINVPDIPDMP